MRRSPGVWGDRDLIDASGSTSGESRPAARGPHRVGSLPGAPACRSHPAHNRTCTRLCLIVHIPAVFRPQPSKAGLNVSAGSRRAYGLLLRLLAGLQLREVLARHLDLDATRHLHLARVLFDCRDKCVHRDSIATMVSTRQLQNQARAPHEHAHLFIAIHETKYF